MVTFSIDYGSPAKTFYGLSTEDKPVEKVYNGSVFYEMDTGSVFMFDAENQRWVEQ